MSTGEDNIFARWSRRKQAVRRGETAPPDEDEGAREATEIDAGPADRQAATEEVETGELLPSLDDLTAESDLIAFLHKGVPDALKSAALRKMWSLDPAIRDYVGPSEYAWDFNQPGSMPGFGPADATKTAVEFLSKVSGGSRAGSETATLSAEAPQKPSPPTPAEPPSEKDAGAPPDGSADAPPAEPLAAADTPPTAEQPADHATESAAGPARAQEQAPATTPRRHGGALPR